MKIDCTCGSRIVDSADYLPNKAYYIADQDMEMFTDEIERLAPGPNFSSELFKITSKYLSRRLYQCNSCGNLLVDQPQGTKGLLNSVMGDSYPASVTGHWRGDNGDIFWNTSGKLEGGFEQFTDFAKLEKRYYEVIEMLKKQKRFSSAWLHEGDKTLHEERKS